MVRPSGTHNTLLNTGLLHKYIQTSFFPAQKLCEYWQGNSMEWSIVLCTILEYDEEDLQSDTSQQVWSNQILEQASNA